MEREYIYRVNGTSTAVRSGTLAAEEIQPWISFSAPPEFYGQPGQWTPEHLIVASVVGCFISTFSGMADYSKFEFISLHLEADGVIEKDEGGWRFARIILRPRLKIAQDKDRERANRLLQKAQKTCLVSRSLACATVLEPELEVEEEVLESEKMGNWIPIS
jgi:peroxiredoxin-like protein